MTKPEDDVQLITAAYKFAANRHATQKRKGAAQEPYINHCSEVADLVAKVISGKDVNLVVAAILHDTVEDTATTSYELAQLFNADIASLVAEVTDNKNLRRAVRKRQQIEKASSKSDRAKILSLADKTVNLRSLTYSPPADWTTERRREYLEWAIEVAKGLRGVSPLLDALFDEEAEKQSCLLKAIEANASGIASQLLPA